MLHPPGGDVDDPLALARELMAGGAATWDAVAPAAEPLDWDAELLYDAAPFGVGYFVAVWTRAVSEGRVVAVVGPTATGKSDLAVALAQRLDGEIVNADSMQLYAGMDIGTAKLPPAERGGVEHHLLDIWPIAQVGRGRRVPGAGPAGHRRDPRPRAAADPGRRLRAVPARRRSTTSTSRGSRRRSAPGSTPSSTAHGPQPLHDRLAELDPLAAAAILPTNGRRIVRALEVIELTGAPFTARMPGFDSIYDLVQIGLDRADLDERVELRVHRMMAQGFLDEVRALLPLGLRASPTAGKALGYAQLLAVLDDAGALTGDLDDADRADGPRHPAFRAPPALLVPPRPAGALARRRRRRPDRSRPSVPWTGEVRQGARDGERLPRAARPRRRASTSAPPRCGPSATGTPASAPTASCGSCAARTTPRPRTWPPTRRSSWTTATPTAASPRCAATEFAFFIEYLLSAGLVEPDAAVATRGGIRRVRSCGDGNVAVAMGQPRLLADRPIATAAPHAPLAGTRRSRCPTRTSSCRVDSAAELAALDLRRPPVVDPPLPHGQNVEFVAAARPAAPAAAGARARGRRDALVRHRHLRRRGRRGPRRRRRAPTAPPGASTSPAAPARSSGTPTARSS